MANQKYVYFRKANLVLIHSFCVGEKIESESAIQGIQNPSIFFGGLSSLVKMIPFYLNSILQYNIQKKSPQLKLSTWWRYSNNYTAQYTLIWQGYYCILLLVYFQWLKMLVPLITSCHLLKMFFSSSILFLLSLHF